MESCASKCRAVCVTRSDDQQHANTGAPHSSPVQPFMRTQTGRLLWCQVTGRVKQPHCLASKNSLAITPAQRTRCLHLPLQTPQHHQCRQRQHHLHFAAAAAALLLLPCSIHSSSGFLQNSCRTSTSASTSCCSSRQLLAAQAAQVAALEGPQPWPACKAWPQPGYHFDAIRCAVRETPQQYDLYTLTRAPCSG